MEKQQMKKIIKVKCTGTGGHINEIDLEDILGQDVILYGSPIVTGRQIPARIDHFVEIVKLAFCRQVAEEKQVNGLREPMPVFRLESPHHLLDIDPAITETAVDRDFFVFIENIPVHVADAGESHEYAGPISVPQSAFDAVFLIQLGIDGTRFGADS